jgi:hypothetical protein
MWLFNDVICNINGPFQHGHHEAISQLSIICDTLSIKTQCHVKIRFSPLHTQSVSTVHGIFADVFYAQKLQNKSMELGIICINSQ